MSILSELGDDFTDNVLGIDNAREKRRKPEIKAGIGFTQSFLTGAPWLASEAHYGSVRNIVGEKDDPDGKQNRNKALVSFFLGGHTGIQNYAKKVKRDEEYAYAKRKAGAAADLLEDEARIAEKTAADKAAKIRSNSIDIKSRQRATLAAAGVDVSEGTSLDIIRETEALSEIDALIAINEGKSYAALLRKQAKDSRDIPAKTPESLYVTEAVMGQVNKLTPLFS